MFIAETMNVALTSDEVCEDDVLYDHRKRLEKESSDLAKMYDTLSGYSLYPKFADCVESLGKAVFDLCGDVSF